MTVTLAHQSTSDSQILPGEVPFDVSEMFFSRTDERGIIQAGNGVFRRVSGYDWATLQGAPHKVIRHDDMPSGVFWLFWQALKNGQAIGAYVKNKSKDGRYYWVFAVASPTDGGYMSVRLKPTSAMLPEIEKLYAELRHEERENGLSAEDSAQLLLQKLDEMGYVNYTMFTAFALNGELQARAKRTQRSLDSWQNRFQVMAASIIDIQNETDEMLAAFRSIRTVPMNMRILASRLENAGGPISAISVNYGAMLDEMTSWVHGFTRGADSPFGRIRDSILTGQFLAFVALVQTEMVRHFGNATANSGTGIDVEAEADRLHKQAAEFRDRAAHALKVVELEAGNLGRSVLDMKRYVTGLSSTRMMCKIESATLDESGDALTGIVDQLDYCQNTIETRLGRISELNGHIQSNTAMLRATV